MFRIRQQNEKYQYVVESDQQWLIRFVSFFGLISIVLLAYGYYKFLEISWALFALLSIPFLIIVLYYGINYLLRLFFRGFDLTRHKKYIASFWRNNKNSASVTILIPAAGEPVDIVTATIKAALAIDYKNKSIYLLDDTKESQYKKITKKLGAKYLHRPNSGAGKKSGNLNYALKHTPKSDHVLVLDADFVARKEILKELVPYAEEDIAIVQSPQSFEVNNKVFQRSKIEYAAGALPKDFYQVTQQSRDRFSSALCVGTNALYYRTALEDVGGFAEIDHSEDVNTGLKMLNHVRGNGEPYRIRYIPIQLASGKCPSDYYAFYKQQSRWCTGSFKLVFSRKTIFSPVLTTSQKLSYFSNCLYYLYTLSILLLPLQFLALNVFKHGDYKWQYTLLFLPQILTRLVIIPLVQRRRVNPFATMIATTANAYTFMQAMFLVVIRKPLGWEATGTDNKPSHRRYAMHKLLSIAYFVIAYIGTFSVAILNGGFGLHISPVLELFFVYAFIAQTIHLFYMLFFSVEGSKSTSVLTIALVAVIAFSGVSIASYEHSRYHLYFIKPVGFTFQQINVSSQQPATVTHGTASKPTDIAQQKPWTDFVYTVKPNQNMSGLISGTLSQEFGTKVSKARLGYTQNYLMNLYGYEELSDGQAFTVKQQDIQNALGASKNIATDDSFWSDYATRVGL